MRVFPFSVYDSERDVFVRWTRAEVQQDRIFVARLFDNLVCRCFGLVDKVGVENIELVPLDDLRRRVVRANETST